MQTPSSLSQLSHAEKDALILMLQEQIKALPSGKTRKGNAWVRRLLRKMRHDGYKYGSNTTS
jgi:hypothetical protein